MQTITTLEHLGIIIPVNELKMAADICKTQNIRFWWSYENGNTTVYGEATYFCMDEMIDAIIQVKRDLIEQLDMKFLLRN